MISVLLADDHPQIMKSLKYLFKSTGDIQLVATAKNGSEAVVLANRYHPDVAVLVILCPLWTDWKQPGKSGWILRIRA